MYYAIYCEDTENSAEKRRSVRPAHLQRLHQLQKQNRLLVAGPLLHEDNQPDVAPHVRGSLIIADFHNIEEAKTWAAADPYVTADVYARVSIFPFKKVLGCSDEP